MGVPGRLLLTCLKRGFTCKGEGSSRMEFLVEHDHLRSLLRHVLSSVVGERILTALLEDLVLEYERSHLGGIGRLTEAVLQVQERLPSSGFAGVSFVESHGNARGPIVIDPPKLKRMVTYIETLSTTEKAELLRSACFDILTGLDKKAGQANHASDEWWLHKLKFIFLNPFDDCNLNCLGCWVRHRMKRVPIFHDLDYIVSQGKRIGVFFVHLSGQGEPFADSRYRNLTFRLVEKHRDVRFTLLTNGTLINEEDVCRIKAAANLLPIISIDGLSEINDYRRGNGVYSRLRQTFRMMREKRVIFCFSTMVHKRNYIHVTSQEFVDELVEQGSSAGLYCQYVRIGEEIDRELALSPEETERYGKRLDEMNRSSEIPLRDLEFLEQRRGCMARRGVSISVDPFSGLVTPCWRTPYAPSECNLFVNRHPERLREILSSGFFRRYRESHTAGHQCFSNLDSELAWFQQAPELPIEVKTRIDKARRRNLPEFLVSN